VTGPQRRFPAIAGEEMPKGCHCRIDGDTAFRDPSLPARGGVARGFTPPDVERIAKGEPIEIQTDGGIKAQLTEAATIRVAGVDTRFGAGDTPYLHLEGGRVIGFQGDGRLGG